ncbi:MAG TPA: thioredoxin, partial [Thermoanaerobaculia bacterium]|nr:thioredoxin [Thermoanaerobaculia bacterium]
GVRSGLVVVLSGAPEAPRHRGTEAPPPPRPRFRNFAPAMEGQVIRCANCGQANRVPAVRDGQKAVCGKCKAPLEASGGPITLTDANFDDGIRDGAYVVDFWAAWCGPCRAIAPVIDALASERTDVRFAKLNVDENPRTAARFAARSIPLLVFFKNGVEAGRVVGAVPRGQIEAAIQRYLA